MILRYFACIRMKKWMAVCGSGVSGVAEGGGEANGVPGAIRTRDKLLRRQLLYPTELQGPVQYT